MTTTNVPAGPFETSAQASNAAAGLREAVRQVDPDVAGPMTEEVRRAIRGAQTGYVTGTLAAAGVELGEYDRHTAAWVSDLGSETVTTILDWVLRAQQAAVNEACLTRPPSPAEANVLAAGEAAPSTGSVQTAHALSMASLGSSEAEIRGWQLDGLRTLTGWLAEHELPAVEWQVSRFGTLEACLDEALYTEDQAREVIGAYGAACRGRVEEERHAGALTLRLTTRQGSPFDFIYYVRTDGSED